MLKITIKDKIACPKHPRYNPEKSGERGARAGCHICLRMLSLYAQVAKLEADVHELKYDAEALQNLLTAVAERRARRNPLPGLEVES